MEEEIKLGVYIGPHGQLVEMFLNELEGAWLGELTMRTSDGQAFWMNNGAMSSELRYLIQGYEYLGEL